MVEREDIKKGRDIVGKIKQQVKKLGRESGQGLLLVLVAMTVGSLVLSGLLAYASITLEISGKGTDQLWAGYAADSGLTTVINDLLQGEDGLSPGYPIPNLTINNYSVAINISSPFSGTEPAPISRYIDPGVGASFGLSSLGSQTQYYFRMDNVRAGSDILVNWAFTPLSQSWKIRLYLGPEPGGIPLAERSDTKGPGELDVKGALISGEVYTLDFMNDSGVALVSAPFSLSGGADKTWIYAQVYKDYLISATAGGNTITVYARQFPGSTDPRTGQKVYIESWKEH